MKTSQQHKGRLLVVVSFFVYFQHVLSLTETSSGNEYTTNKEQYISHIFSISKTSDRSE